MKTLMTTIALFALVVSQAAQALPQGGGGNPFDGLQGQIDGLQTQIDNIELTPARRSGGTTGAAGCSRPGRSAGTPGCAGARGTSGARGRAGAAGRNRP